jgi:hypothetical protein
MKGREMRRFAGILGGTALSLLVLSAGARPSESDDAEARRAVQSTIEAFLSDLGNMRLDKLAGYFTPKATMVVVRKTPQGFTNSFQTVEEWLARLRSNPNPRTFEEPLSNLQITIDSGQLAYLRADFKVIRDGKVVSSGVDQFTLVKEEGGWKIAATAYTSLPEGQP